MEENSMGNKKLRITGTLAAAVAAGFGLSLLLNGVGQAPSVYAQETTRAPAISQDAIAGAERLSDAFRNAAKVLRPSVVTITSLEERSSRTIRRFQGRGLPEEFRGMLPDELFEQFRGPQGDFEEEDTSPRGGRKVQTGMGSGVIVSPDGYILTNNHVVADADELQVELSDGRRFEADVVGTDEKSDVAVLKIQGDGLVAARIGDSSRMEVGDWVIAIGSPFGLDQTVTAGIVSARHRQTGIISERNAGYEDFIQTDAAINPGNSGGPLINLRGEVIGVNTAINSRTGTSAGVGFAIPSNMAARIMEDLRTDGKVVRGFIGVSFAPEDVTYENADEFQLPRGVFRGAIVASVLEKGPADRATLRKGDIVTSIAGRAVSSFREIRNIVALSRPGAKLDVQVYRKGRPVNLQIKIGTQTEAKMLQLAGRAEVPGMGIVIERVTPALARQAGTSGEDGGVMVIQIDRGGTAYQYGLRLGDIILRVDGEETREPSATVELLNSIDESSRIVVERKDREIMLPL